MLCEKCNSILDNGILFCPVCGFQVESITENLLGKNEENDTCTCGYPKIHGSEVCPNCGLSSHEKKNEEVEVSFSHLIKLVPTNQEKDNYSEIYIDQNYKELNRNDIDEEDFFISGSSHVKFYKKNNKWYIENTSSNSAVFIQIKKNLMIKNGDIILLGRNKFYEIQIIE